MAVPAEPLILWLKLWKSLPVTFDPASSSLAPRWEPGRIQCLSTVSIDSDFRFLQCEEKRSQIGNSTGRFCSIICCIEQVDPLRGCRSTVVQARFKRRLRTILWEETSSHSSPTGQSSPCDSLWKLALSRKQGGQKLICFTECRYRFLDLSKLSG